MSKELINAAELIKEECSKHEECKECFYGCVDEEGLTDCIMNSYEYSPSQWDLSELEERE